MLQNFKVGTRIGLGSILVLVLAIAVIVPVMLGKFSAMAGDAEHRELNNLYQSIQADIAAEGKASEMVATVLANVPDLQKAMADGDRARIGEMLIPVFKALKQSYGAKQMQYHTPPATSFFRVHDPAKSGDDLSSFRHTVVQVNADKKPVRGLEKGRAGIGIRGVVPVFYDGRHIGSAELGMSFGPPFFEQFKRRHDVDVGLWLPTDNGFEAYASTFGDKSQFTPEELARALQGQAVVRESERDGRPEAIYANVIRDFSGKPLGVVEIAMDRSHYAGIIASTRNTVLGIALAVLLLGIAVAALVSRGITRPLKTTVSALRGIAKGEGDLTHRLKVEGRDEVAELSLAFNEFASKIQELVREIWELGKRLHDSGDRMKEITAETDQGVARQASETDQVATAINEMAATVQEVARNAAGAAEAAANADREAQSGHGEVNRTIGVIDALASEVRNAAEAMRTLEADSKNIGAVLDVIRGIAEQTNLLALNAAIEAARAGEQGRGFAVVADEVRSLASRTQDSTQQIKEMIERLQSGANNAVKVMDSGRTRAQNNVQQATQAEESLEIITKAVGTINDMNMQIASAAEEQSSVSEEINRNIHNISQVTDETSKGVQQSTELCGEVMEESKQLQILMGKFQV